MKQVFFLFAFFLMLGVNVNAQALSFDATQRGTFRDAANSELTVTDNGMTVDGVQVGDLKAAAAGSYNGTWSTAKAKNVKVRFVFKRAKPTDDVASVDVLDAATQKVLSSYMRKSGGRK